MSLTLRGASALALGLFLAPAASAQPATPLTAVPADAVIVVQLHGLDRTKERLKATLKNAVPDEGAKLAAQAEEQLKKLTQGRDLKGAAKDGPVFLAFTQLPGPDMEAFQKSAVLMVATGDYKAFRDGLLKESEKESLKRDPAGFETATLDGETVCLFPRGGFACIAASPAVATKLSKERESDPGLTKKLGPAAASFLEPDLAVFVDIAAVNQQYGNEIKSFQQLMEFALQQAETGGLPGIDKSQVEAAKSFFNGFFQALDDCRSLILAADFRPTGVALSLQTRFGPDSRSNEVLKAFRPAALTDLGTLPVGQTTYTAVQTDDVLLKSLGALMMGTGLGGAGGAGGGDEVKKAATALFEQANGPWLSAFSFPTSGLQVGRYKDPAKAVELTTRLLKALPEGAAYQNAYLKGKSELKADDQKHRGFTFQYARVRYDLEKMASQVPDESAKEAIKEAMKKLVGTENHIWYGTDGKQFLTVTAKDWPAAQALVDAYLDSKSLAKNAGFQAVLKELPAESSMLFVTDAPRLAVAMGDYIGSMVKAMPGFPGEVPSFKPVTGPPAFAGMALTLKAQEGRLDIFVPSSAIQAVRKAVGSGVSD